MDDFQRYAVITKNLTKYFGSFKAVDSINLRVPYGYIFGLLGPNGAGKTTTLRMICGILQPSEGEIYVLGRSVKKERKRILKYIGYMPQKFSLYEDLTVLENLKLFGRLYGVKEDELNERIQELLDELMLREYKDRLAGKLSGGTKQRLALAVALIHRPKLLIVDEPTAGVDPPLRRAFWNYFRKLKKQGVTIIVTTHYMDEAENCDRLSLMFRGRIIAEGTPLEIKREALGGELIELSLSAEKDYVNKLEELLVHEVLKIEDVVPERNGRLKVRVLVEDSSEALPNLLKSLERHGFEVIYSDVIQISLEEAFIRIIERGVR